LQQTTDAVTGGQYVPDIELRLLVNNTVRYIHQSGKKITDTDGHTFIYGVWQDTTKALEKDELRDFLKELTNASIDGIVAVDRNYTILVWNRQAELFTGLAGKDVIGRNLLEVNPALQKKKAVMDALKRGLEGLTSFVPAELTGTGSYYENHYIPVRDKRGAIRAIMNIQHDVAHRLKAENELRELNASLAAGNREMKRRNAELQAFSHITSHDFKDPLRKIYTAIELLVNNDLPRFSEKGRMHFRQIQGSVQRIGLLADDILSFSALDAEKTAFPEVDLNQVLEFAQKRLEAHIVRTGAVIKTATLPMYRGHRLMLTQLFLNILDNAIKFQEEDNRPVISIEPEYVAGNSISHPDVDPAARYLVLHIADNGIGFDKKYVNRIFEVFMRINRSKFPGVGTGLALCRKIAELHGGFIVAESEQGQGSIFHCYLQEDL
jgi:PAS domain S-box-containing protein